MKLTFYLPLLNHHQACLADELYGILGQDFKFVELNDKYESKGATEDYSTRPYLLRPWLSQRQSDEAELLLFDSDICVFGSYEALPYLLKRAQTGKVSFDISERWLKKGWWNILSPRLLKMAFYYYRFFRNRPLYKLCASAFAADDFNSLGMFKDRCYRWGYFTHVPDFINEDRGALNLMWCSRFISWKHPELPILLADRLRREGININIDMYGTGELIHMCKSLVERLDLSHIVHFNGFCSNDEIIRAMNKHDVFLFTSDRNEGWGAVLNEAMGVGCVPVVSDEIGAAPFLIKDYVNGLLFNSNNLDSLYDKVKYLIENPDVKIRMAREAYSTMRDVWSPKNAARNLLTLSESILQGSDSNIEYGPGSKIYM